MKWKNKGHELDEYAESLLEIFRRKQRKLYIFGAGLIGAGLASVLEKYPCFAGYIDNDAQKQDSGIKGWEVISFEQFVSDGANGIIIIAADVKNIPDIEEQLTSIGLITGKDFWVYKLFMQEVLPVLSVYEYNISYVEMVQISLTERCTLKCRDCAHGCFAVDPKSQDMSSDLVKKSADTFFSKIDLVKDFVLIGGEPFLYGNLAEMIEYIGEKYRNQMIGFSITTNGTILPGQEILDLCRKYKVLVRISNYSGTIKHLEQKYNQLIKKLGDSRVLYVLGDRELQWMDYGFNTVDRKNEKNELIQTFDKCKTPCREIRGNKYYYCVMARSVSENLGLNIGTEDYLDLNDLKNDKKILLEFGHGYSEKGYLDMCNHCRGADAVRHPIKAAEQV